MGKYFTARRPPTCLCLFFLLALLGACSSPNKAPTASLEATPATGRAPLEVSLDASGSSDPDGTINSFLWDFGDGSSGDGAQVKHMYQPGTFTATVTVTDDQGATAAAETAITVAKPAPGQNQKPTALVKTTPTKGQAPLEVMFDAAASSDPDGKIASFAWDFGDGKAGSGVQVSHTYKTVGVFTATVTVTDNQGAIAAAEAVVTVTDEPPSGSDLSGTIILSGTLGETGALNRAAVPELRLEPGPRPAPSAGGFVPGEVIVQFKPGSVAAAAQRLTAQSLTVAGQRLERVRPLPIADTYLYRAGEAEMRQDTASQATSPTAASRTLEVVARLAERADIVTALPNRVYYAAKTPDDPFYSLQWHYPAVNLPQAWDITTGSAETVVAVVDTGILGNATDARLTHPDFVGRLLPGYDFISDADAAGDGDGRDADPYDQGTFQSNGTHGSHVAGIIAANSDDGVGVAGIDWAAKILPVRVLDTKGRGTFSDILDGIAWAAGLNVEGAPVNPRPADVINLSLSGDGPCDAVEKELFDSVIARGSLVVVAAGNGNEDAGFASPGNCDAVITVGAVDFKGQRAPYSNFGGKLDVLAPGGDVGADFNDDHYPDGVLSTVYEKNNGGFYWDFLQGTSMAAPHVAGIAALLKAVDPTLEQAQVETLLKATARPRSAGTCNGPKRDDLTAADCGAGLVDALAAVQAAQSGSLPTPSRGELKLSPSRLDFGTTQTELSLRLSNSGNGSLNWRFDTVVPDPNNPSAVGAAALELSATGGTLPAGGQQTVKVTLDRRKATANGNYHLDLTLKTGEDAQGLPVFFSKGEAAPPPGGDLSGTLTTACFVSGDACDLDKSRIGTIQDSADSAPYTFADVDTGQYRLIAWKDVNDNDQVDSGDLFGFYSLNGLGTTEVTPPAESLDFSVAAVTSDDAAGAISRELAAFLVAAKLRAASP